MVIVYSLICVVTTWDCLFYYWNCVYIFTSSVCNTNRLKMSILKRAIHFISREWFHSTWLCNSLLSFPGIEDELQERVGHWHWLWFSNSNTFQAVRIPWYRIISFQQGDRTFIQRNINGIRNILWHMKPEYYF